MLIILKHIPAKTSRQDIKNFLTPEVKGGLLRKSGQIVDISILAQRSIRTRALQYHGLVDIRPDLVAERVIKKLNRKIIAGKRVAVCEYKIRNWRNDPRVSKHNSLKKRSDDRRVCERRELYEELTTEELSISSKRTFHTKGW